MKDKSSGALDSIESFFSSVFINLILFIISIVIFFGMPTIFILSIPLFLLRLLIGKAAPTFKPEFGKMVTTRGTVFATDNLFTVPKCNLLVGLIVQGNIDYDRALEICQRMLIDSKYPNGEYKYPELKQYLTYWAGYYFWKDDKDFDLKNHIRVVEDPDKTEVRDEDIQRLRQGLIAKAWIKKRSTWEILFTRNYYPKGAEDPGPHTSIILRLHHSMGDGYSWLFLIIEGLCETPLNNALPSSIPRSVCSNIRYALGYPFKWAFETAWNFSLWFTPLTWRVPRSKDTGTVYVDMTDRIELSKIKKIKDHFKVSFSSVVFAFLAGTIRDMFVSKRVKVPKTLPSITALPIPGHSSKLRNYMAGTIALLPVGEADPIKRLQLCEKEYKRLKRSTTPGFSVYYLMIIGSYPSPITKFFGKNYLTSSGFSNFPAGFDNISFDGHTNIDAMFTAGLQHGYTGFGFCALSYVKGFRVSPILDGYFMNGEETKEVSRMIENQIDILYEFVQENV